MKRFEVFIPVFAICLLVLASASGTKVQALTGTMETFLDSEIPGIRIQVNATAETQPTANITVMLSLSAQTNANVSYFNLDVFGSLNGTSELRMVNITEPNRFQLNATIPIREYNCTFMVHDRVWGRTYGKISITYSTSLPSLDLTFGNITNGFLMTLVENTRMKDLESQLDNLTEEYGWLNDNCTYWIETFNSLNETNWQLCQNYTSLQQNYTYLQNNGGELDNTRRVTAILAITTIFFVATTIYMVIRKPKEYW